MDRKSFLALLGWGLLAAPKLRAQQLGPVSRIGVLLPGSGPSPEELAFREKQRPLYRALGWVDGQNMIVERRWAGTDPGRWREVAAELKALRVALIVTTGTVAIGAARDGAPGVPIVMVNAADPVDSGFAQSLARPGGDLTGTSAAGEELVAKQLEFLSVAAPLAKKVTVLMNPASAASGFFFAALSAAAKQLGLQLERIDLSKAEEIDAAVSRAKGGALFVMNNLPLWRHYPRIAELALRAGIPATLADPAFVRAGGLLSYVSPGAWHWDKAASYIDKILRGAKPADLPIEQPTHFELAINMKTARALGLKIPQSLLLRATEVIE